jgi:predicted MFS family arabinose efflux permease
MAFQFESVAAVAPLLGARFDASLADIGFLIGLYFTPGVALSLPSGAIGQKFGDKRTVLAALLLMLAGNLAMALTPSWSGQIAGRFAAGAGGVLLNVQLTKMTTDWFAGHEIATAMAILVNSWPAGIALALLSLPLIGTAYGIGVVDLAVAIVMAIAVALATTYQPPANTIATAAAHRSSRPDTRTLFATSVAGLMWGFYNVGFATIFSFGPTMLVERGWSMTAAGSTISIVLWLAIVGVPFGGFVADRVQRPQTILVGGCILSAVLMATLPRSDAVIAIIFAIGLISGQPAGPMLSLPAQMLQPATRAIGMGVFYTFYYAGMMLGPVVAGGAAKWTGSAVAAIDIGAVAFVACPALLLVFNRLATNAAPGGATAAIR